MIELGLKVMLVNQMLHQIIKVMVGQRGDVAALAAYQMMMRGRGCDFIHGLAINFGRNHDLQVAKKCQRAVHGGSINGRCRGVNTFVDFVGCGVMTDGANSIQDYLALRRHPAALFVNALDVV